MLGFIRRVFEVIYELNTKLIWACYYINFQREMLPTVPENWP